MTGEPQPLAAGQAGPAGESAVRPVTDEDRVWVNLADELTPAKSLERVDTATDRVVRTVTIIGTLLGGFGVFGATKPSVSGPARWITIAAVACAALAVACALAAQILTISRHLNPENLAEVRAWYKRRIDTRGYPTRAATLLLLIGAVLAGVAAIVALATATPSQPTIAVTRALDHAAVIPSAGTTPGASTPGTGAPPTTTITLEVTFPGLTSGQSATVVVSAATTGQVLASAAMTPATDGTATRTLTVSGLPPAEPVAVVARGGSQQCRATLGAGSARPTVTCAPTSH
ncbi:MAG: hypothetical protein ACRDND_01035 [Streptosporangiaceae bacterium]